MKNGKKLILLVAVALTACGCQKAIFESQLKAYVVRSGTDEVELNTLVFTDDDIVSYNTETKVLVFKDKMPTLKALCSAGLAASELEIFLGAKSVCNVLLTSGYDSRGYPQPTIDYAEYFEPKKESFHFSAGYPTSEFSEPQYLKDFERIVDHWRRIGKCK